MTGGQKTERQNKIGKGRGVICVPGVLHCFSPAVAASALGSGSGWVALLYSVGNIGIAVGQPENVVE